MHVVHSVGPDLREGQPTREQVLALLATAYGNVLQEFLVSVSRGLQWQSAG